MPNINFISKLLHNCNAQLGIWHVDSAVPGQQSCARCDLCAVLRLTGACEAVTRARCDTCQGLCCDICAVTCDASQAAELGLSHQALLRNLVNAALRRSHTSPSAPGDATQQQPPAEPAAATATDKAGKKRGRSATPAAAATAAATAGATAAATASGTSETVSPEAYAELEAAVLAAAEERGREGVWEATGELAPPPDVDPTKLALAIPWAPDRLSLAAVGAGPLFVGVLGAG